MVLKNAVNSKKHEITLENNYTSIIALDNFY